MEKNKRIGILFDQFADQCGVCECQGSGTVSLWEEKLPAWLQKTLQSLMYHQYCQPVLVTADKTHLDRVAKLVDDTLAKQGLSVPVWQVPPEAVTARNAPFFAMWRGLISAQQEIIVVVAPKEIMDMTTCDLERTRFSDIFRVYEAV